MDIITRAEANLPAPPSTLTRHSGPWPGITWHHTGGSYTTWRAIYDWQVVQRPVDARLPYIGYSYGIARGRVTELRGWNLRPAGDHENSRLQVCFMGTWDSKLPPAEDLAAAREFLAWATAKNGAPLPGVSHRDVWPAGHRYDTDCPGDALHAWLKTMGDDMATPIEFWTHDLVNGPAKEEAYKVLNRAAAAATDAAATGKALLAAAAAEETRDKAALAAIQALATAGGVDAAPILAKVQEVADGLGRQLGEVQAELAEQRAENEQLRERLAAALAAAG